MNDELQKAVEVFNRGGIVIFPTDTAFGIGCRIDREDAVQRLFKLRKRSETKAMPILVSSIEMAKKYVQEVPTDVQSLMEKYWPGALTIILPAQTDKIPSLVRGGGETIGIRMPDDNNLLSIISKVGVPILGSSANFANEQTPYSISDLDKNLVQKADFVLDGQTKLRQASTVIDCCVKPWKKVRQGAVQFNNPINE